MAIYGANLVLLLKCRETTLKCSLIVETSLWFGDVVLIAISLNFILFNNYIVNPFRVVLLTAGLIGVEFASRIILGGNLQPIIIIGYSLGAFLVALYFDWLIPILTYDRMNLWLILWLNLFIIGSFINMIEGWFFTTIYSGSLDFLFGAMVVLVISGIQSAISAIIIPNQGEETFQSELMNQLKQRGASAFIKALILGGFGYFPIYFIFGMLISPFIIKYYNDPSLGLVIPPFSLIIPLEVLRGFMFVGSLLPLIVGLKTRRTIFIACAAMLFIPGSLIPMIGDVGLPAQIIPYHTVELFCDSTVYGYILARLFTPK